MVTGLETSRPLNTEYLGDGVYVRDEGYTFAIFAERGFGTHVVYLEDDAISSLLKFIERTRNVTITVTKNEVAVE